MGQVFLLEDGPRAGQLVDELPRGYAPADGSTKPREAMVFADFVAQRAVWTQRAVSR